MFGIFKSKKTKLMERRLSMIEFMNSVGYRMIDDYISAFDVAELFDKINYQNIRIGISGKCGEDREHFYKIREQLARTLVYITCEARHNNDYHIYLFEKNGDYIFFGQIGKLNYTICEYDSIYNKIELEYNGIGSEITIEEIEKEVGYRLSWF